MSKYVTADDLSSEHGAGSALVDELTKDYGEGNVLYDMDSNVDVYVDGDHYGTFSTDYTINEHGVAEFTGTLVGEDLDEGEEPTSLSASITLTPAHMVEALEKMDEEDPLDDDDQE